MTEQTAKEILDALKAMDERLKTIEDSLQAALEPKPALINLKDIAEASQKSIRDNGAIKLK